MSAHAFVKEQHCRSGGFVIEGGGGVGAEEEWREERFTQASRVSVYGH